MDSSFPCEDFLQYVNGAFTAPKDPSYQDSKFHNRLRDESRALLSPLVFSENKDSEITELTNQGTDASALQHAQDMSKRLNLSPKECLKWIKVSLPRYQTEGFSTPSQLAFTYMLNERIALLTAFLELIKARHAKNLHEELKQTVQRFIEELKQHQSPIIVLLDQLKAFIESNRFAGAGEFEDACQDLCWLTVQCVFYLAYSPLAFVVQQSEVQKILETMKFVLSRLSQDTTKDNLFQVSFVLQLTFINVTNFAQIKDVDITTISNILKPSDWDQKFRALSIFTWEQYKMKSSASRGNSDELWKVSSNALKCVERIVSSSIFIQDQENIEIFCDVFDALCCDFIIGSLDFLPSDVENIDLEDINQLKAQLLFVLTKLYELVPSSALKFWETGDDWEYYQRLHSFMRTPFGSMFPSNTFYYTTYMDMLSAVAGTKPGALYIYDHLQGTQLIGWDSFFEMINHFLSNFRQHQQDARMGHQTRQQASVGIPEDDALVLKSMLRLIRQVCEHSEQVRLKIANNPKWEPVPTLFEFVSCSLPIPLKALIMDVLSAFALSPTIQQRIWPFLEIQRTYPRSRVNSGEKFVHMVEKDLQNVESKQQDYSYTISFLSLLQKLLNPDIFQVFDVTIYLTYTRHVFLTFKDRKYEDTTQLWKVASLCLEIYYSILKDSPLIPIATKETKDEVATAHNAVYQKRISQAVHTPALQLLSDFTHSKTDSIFNTILLILHSAKKELYSLRMEHSSGIQLERAVLLCVSILECVIEQEENFGTYFPDKMLTVPSCHLLHGEDGLFVKNILFLIAYPYNPNLPLGVIRILILLSQSQSNRGSSHLDRLTSILSDISAFDIQRQFYVLLQQPEISETFKEIKQAILLLLLSNSKSRAPNLSHFLLGFGVEVREMKRIDLNKHQCSCLRVIISSLYNSHTFPLQEPHLCEMYYHLLYELCSNSYTSEPVLRFLRHFEEFYPTQLQIIPDDSETESLLNTKAKVLLQRSWLLKTLALELHMSAADRRKPSHRLLDYLLQSTDSNNTQTQTDSGNIHSFSQTQFSNQKPSRMKIIELLDDIMTPLPKVQEVPSIFDVNPNQFRTTTPQGIPFIDVNYLTIVLAERIKRLQHENMATPMNLENHKKQAKQVIQLAVDQNIFYEVLAAKLQLFGAWKQIIEVMVFEYFEYVRQQKPLYDFLEVLLNYYFNSGGHIAFLHDPLAEAISDSVLTIMGKLHQLFYFGSSSASGRDLPLTKLHSILNGFIKGIFSHGTTQTMRGNLYVSLLYFLRLTRYQLDQLPLETQQPSKMWWIAGEVASNQKLMYGNIEILERHGDKLIELICKDAASGLEVWKSTAFGLLDTLMSYDRKYQWLNLLEQRGYLRLFVNDLVQQDEPLQRSIVSPDMLKLIYVYESKMSLFTHLAQNSPGAQKLVASDIIPRLTRCQFIDQRPEPTGSAENDSWFPSIAQRYHQLLIPVLELISSLLTSLPQNSTLVGQILEFISAHSELFSVLLRNRMADVTLESLKELRLCTLIFYRVSKHPELCQEKLHGQSLKFQHLLVHLVAKYFASENQSRPGLYEPQQEQKRVKYEVSSICQNLAAYCSSLSSGKVPSLLFSFAPSEPHEHDHSMIKGHSPSIKILIEFLKESLSELTTAQKLVTEQQEKLRNSNDLSLEDLKQLDISPGDVAYGEYEHAERQRVAQLCLQDMVTDSYSRISILQYTIENVLAVLWRQLDFTLSTNTVTHSTPSQRTSKEARYRSLQDIRNSLLTLLPKIPKAFDNEQAGFTEKLCNKLDSLLAKVK